MKKRTMNPLARRRDSAGFKVLSLVLLLAWAAHPDQANAGTIKPTPVAVTRSRTVRLSTLEKSAASNSLRTVTRETKMSRAGTPPKAPRQLLNATHPAGSVSGFAPSSGGPDLPTAMSSLELPLTPFPSASFEALPDDGTAYVPDIAAAVGPAHLMVALNSQVRIQNRQGQPLGPVSLDDFWAGLGNPSCSQPRLLYDPYGQRWVFIANANPGETNAGLVVAVSQTTDPTGNWYQHFISTTTPVDVYADWPTLGFNKDWIAVQANMFYRATDEFYSSYVYALNKTNLYAGHDGQPLRFALLETPDDYPGGSQMPAYTYDEDSDKLYFVQSAFGDDGTGFGALRIFSLEGSPPNAPVFNTTDSRGDLGPVAYSSDTWSETPPTGVDNFAPQLDLPQNSPLATMIAFKRSSYRANTLWAVHTVYVPAGGAPDRAIVQWWTLTPTLGDVLEQGRVDAGPNDRFFTFPSIAVNRDFDLMIGYSRFDRSHYPSAGYVFSGGGDPPGSTRGDHTIRYGEAPYAVTNSSGVNLWGTYSATVLDPLNDTEFWTVQEFAALPDADGDHWKTWWARISPDVDLAVTIQDSPDPVYAGAELTYTIIVTNTLPRQSPGVVVTHTCPPIPHSFRLRCQAAVTPLPMAWSPATWACWAISTSAKSPW